MTVCDTSREIRVSIPTMGMSPQEVESFLKWLQVDASSRHSELVGDVVSDLSDQIKSVWWAENKDQFMGDHGQPVKQV